jgi:hypothetical protein
MSPNQDAFTRSREVTDCGNHVGRPNPSTGEKDHQVNVIVFLHDGKCRFCFFLGSNNHVMLLKYDTAVDQRFFGIGDDFIVDKGCSHRILQSVLVHPVNNKSGYRFPHFTTSFNNLSMFLQ